MRFLLHGTITPAGAAALKKHEHTTCTLDELLATAGDDPTETPADLLKLLTKKQWQLFTTDAALVHRVFEEKLEFPGGLIVLLLDDPAVMGDQAAAVERLFERYKRLSPRRLYTVTASRVKIRQLPGLPE